MEIPYDVIAYIAEFCDIGTRLAIKTTSKIMYNRIKREIGLFKFQREHYNRILNILNKNYAYLDTSMMGSGKTIITLAIAKTYNIPIMVICPPTMKEIWEFEAKKYEIEIKDIISYESLRGTDKHKPKHGLLILENMDYYITKKYIEIVKNGVLLIFDEVHRIKNNNSQLEAAVTLARGIFSIGGKSRISLLSATPIDDVKSVPCILKMLGIIVSNDKLVKYDRINGSYDMYGLQEVVNKCNNINQSITTMNMNNYDNRSKISAIILCYKLYLDIIKNEITSSVILPNFLCHNKYFVNNGLYKITDTKIDNIIKLIDDLKNIINYDETNDEVKLSRGNLGLVMKILRKIEEEKLEIFINLIENTLNNDNNSKIIIYLNYLENIEKLKEKFKSFSPIILTGKTDIKKRISLVSSFQEPNLNKRLIISHPKIGGLGLSLDDTDGTFKRYVYISPSYNFIDQYQIIGRVMRSKTKSIPLVSYVYIDNIKEEQKILYSLSFKSHITSDIIYNNTDDFFNDYPTINYY